MKPRDTAPAWPTGLDSPLPLSSPGRAFAAAGHRARPPFLALAGEVARRWVWPLLLLLVMAVILRAQEAGSITGVAVSTWDGSPLASVAVSVRGTTLASQTDASGRFTLNNVPPGDQVLRFSKSGFATAVVTDVRVRAGQTSTVNGNLRPEFYELEEFEVTAEEFTDQTEKIMFERQQSSSLLDAIGSEQFARMGAKNAADIVSKVAGVTIDANKNPVVRGLNERYVGMQLNGAEVPSPDPYHKSAPLDLFPSSVIDRIDVNKSFSPDQPGNFTGGGINIITKSFPEKFFMNASAGASYNTHSTLNPNFLNYKGGSLDWLAMDDGTRALPSELAVQPLTVPSPTFSSGVPANPNYAQRVANANLLQEQTQAMGTTQFSPTREAPPFNNNLAFAFGDSKPLFGRPFGYLAGMSYDRKFYFYDQGVSRRYVVGSTPGELVLRKDFEVAQSLTTVNWAANVNLSYQPFEDHQVGFDFLYNQNSDDIARQQVGTTSDDPGFLFHLNRLQFTERNLNTYQLRGQDKFPDLADLKLDWLASLSLTSQDEPDTRFFNYLETGQGYQTGSSALPNPDFPTRYFRTLDENNHNFRIDLTQPFHQWSDQEAQFKFGGYYSGSKRDFIDREIYYPGTVSFEGNPNSFLTEDNLGYDSTTNRLGAITYHWNRYIAARDSVYTGEQQIPATYAMLEMPLLQQMRLVGGVRLESTDLNIESSSYIANSVTGKGQNTTVLKETDLLPAASLVWSVRKNMNVRGGFSQTIARPTFRELAAYRSYDPILDELLDGNPNLTLTHIDNYDLRWEWFPRPGEILAVSAFYKSLEDAIEKTYITVEGDIITFRNRPSAKVYGLELEARKALDFIEPNLDVFSLGLNFSLMQSEAALTPNELTLKRHYFPDTPATRALYDQSPYILNADFSYENPRSGTVASLIFNVFGPRITIASLNTPDVYEQPAPVLDFVVSQKLSRHFKVKFSAQNLLDPQLERTYGKTGSQLYSSYARGRTFGLTLSYDY